MSICLHLGLYSIINCRTEWYPLIDLDILNSGQITHGGPPFDPANPGNEKTFWPSEPSLHPSILFVQLFYQSWLDTQLLWPPPIGGTFKACTICTLHLHIILFLQCKELFVDPMGYSASGTGSFSCFMEHIPAWFLVAFISIPPFMWPAQSAEWSIRVCKLFLETIHFALHSEEDWRTWKRASWPLVSIARAQ